MLTPPPSPQPKKGESSAQRTTPSAPPSPLPSKRSSPTSSPTTSSLSEHAYREGLKRRTGRRFRYAIILVPLILVAITATARILTHEHSSFKLSSLPTSFLLGNLVGVSSPENAPERRRPLQHHKRQVSASPTQTATSARASGSSSSPVPSASGVAVPTVPSSPPPLPTPFPQPYDGMIAQNFSSMSCLNFFTNMTNAQPFRSCRPFSLLLQSSDDFISAQGNLTLLNNILWGTCNTGTAEEQCAANMGWFASSLRTQCAQDLKDENAMAVSSLTALEAYGAMREAACLVDPTTNTYCFLNAARDSGPSNLYYYSLPLGLKLPKTADPQCTACLKSLMGSYATSLKDAAQVKLLPGLMKTYEQAADLTLGKCGVGYAVTGLGNAAAGGRLVASWERQVLIAIVSLVLGSALMGSGL